MKPILFADEMKSIDNYTINNIGIEGCVLMERAALFVVDILEKYVHEHNVLNPHIAIICGNGNNGGDGYAVARILCQEGYKVSVIAPFIDGKKSPDNLKQLQILKHLGLSIYTTFAKEEYDIIIDALFGIGLNRPLTGEYADIVNIINDMTGYKMAVDIPSGLNTDTGEVMGVCVKADCTVTMQYEKIGLYIGKGKEYSGKIHCGNIGIWAKESGVSYRVFAYRESVGSLLPARPKTGNKGTFGKVLVIAGDYDMAGACFLCANAAFHSGCGMVKIITHSQNREIIQSMLPEAMLLSMEYDDTAKYPEVLKSMEWADSIVIGPGMGRNEKSLSLLRFCISNTKIPIVIDADGLWLIAKHSELISELSEKEFVFTPHIQEFSLLSGKSIEDIKKDIYTTVEEYLNTISGTLVLKDAVTLIGNNDYLYKIINTIGNDGMATAGSGDVLAGIIGALLARGLDTFEAAAVGVYWHGLAGNIASLINGKNALMATDIINSLSKAETGAAYD